jgi:hypothetical protein
LGKLQPKAIPQDTAAPMLSKARQSNPKKDGVRKKQAIPMLKPKKTPVPKPSRPRYPLSSLS